ncbi:MAG: hypothetical protein AABY15_00780 [Nanoarchaeota archaeon]
METDYKNLEGLVIKISREPDVTTKDKEAEIDVERDYFYSTIDAKVHKATSWISYYYYDEDGRAHPHEQVYKVLATSDQKKYPELPLLTVADLAKK